MTDSETTIAQLRRLVNDFVDRRDWHQFHSPKNLSMSMANEMGLDLSTAVHRKLAKNEQKYPAEQYRGRFGPEDGS